MIPYFGNIQYDAAGDSELRRKLTREGGHRNVAGDDIMSQRGRGEVHPSRKVRSRVGRRLRRGGMLDV